MSKAVPDRILSAMITKTLLIAEDEHLELTSRDIHDYISSNSFYFESPELDKFGRPLFSGDYTYNNLPALRRSLVYMRHMGYISKQGEAKPYYFTLTNEGRIMAADPFFKYKLKMEYMHKIVEELVNRTLANDESVEYLAEQKMNKKCDECRLNNPKAKRLPARANTVRPHRGKILVNRKDDSIREYEVNEETGEIKELEDLKAAVVTRKDGSIDTESTIMTLQNKNVFYQNALVQAGIDVGILNKQLQKEQGRKTLRSEREFVRQMSRMEVGHYYYENGMVLDADFFEIWGGSLAVVEYKRLLEIDGILNKYYDLIGVRSEIMQRTDYVNRIVRPDEIPSIQIQVIGIQANSITFDSPYFKAEKTVKV